MVSGARSPKPASDAQFALEVARSSSLKNFRKPRRRLERAFSQNLVVFLLEQVAQSAPRLDFRVRNMVVFRSFSCVCCRVGETL